MTKSNLLTHTQKEKYQQEGFLVINNFIDTNICDLLIDRIKYLVDSYDTNEIKTIFSTKTLQHVKSNYFLESGDKNRFFFEESAINQQGELTCDKLLALNKIGHALHDLDPVFNCFSRMHSIAQLVNELGVIDPLLIQSMYIFKQPFIGGEVSCHQDNTYLYTNPPITGLWFALQDATIENGCLWAIPGGHNTSLKSRMLRHNNDTTLEMYDDRAWPLEKMIALEVPRGSVIVLHGLLPHMSKENKSSYSRHAYTLHVMSRHQAWSKNNWLQRGEQLPFRGFF